MSDDATASKARARTIFNQLAADYDSSGPRHFAYFGQRLVDFVAVEPGQRLLDVATGRGAVLFPAAARVGVDGEAIGIDLAEEMVRATSEELARRGITARVEVMDAEQLTFPDATFDTVLCGFGLMFFPNLDRALSGFRRVLKPRGHLGLSTWRITQSDDLAIVLEQLGYANPGTGVLQFKEPAVVEQVLMEAGFTAVQATIAAQDFRYADLDEYWQTARGTGMRGWLNTLNAEQLARANEALAERLRPARRADGYHVAASAVLTVASR